MCKFLRAIEHVLVLLALALFYTAFLSNFLLEEVKMFCSSSYVMQAQDQSLEHIQQCWEHICHI